MSDLRHLKAFRPTLLACVACLALLAWPIVGSSQANIRPYRIMVLYWDNKDFLGNIKFDDSFRAVLQAELGGNFEYYPEYLETTRFPDQDLSFFRDYLQQKYRGRTMDVVVASADLPLNFLIAHRADLFPDAPIVFVANNPPSPDRLSGAPGMTGVVHQSTHRQTVELALKLHPNTKQMFVISGSRERDKRFETVARHELSGFVNRVEITYLTDLPLSELISKTASLPANSIALYIWQQAPDENGKLLQTYEVISRIAPSSPVPIYGLGSGNLGNGTVGGYLTGPPNNGRRLAEITARILKGTPARDIAVEPSPSLPMFDWRELKRWGISESSLPAGSTVLFRQLTFWDHYKWYIISLVAVVIIEAMLIAWLLFIRIRRRQAEEENLRLAQVAETERRRLGEIVSNVPGIVWESLVDPETKQRKTTFISDYLRKMLGYTPEEWLDAPPGFGLKIMPEEDRAQAMSASEAVLAGGKEGSTQFRWLAKDGRTVWAENYLSPIFNGNEKIIGLRGVTLDITERKLGEESQRQTEEKDRAILSAIPDLMFLQTRDGVYLDVQCSDLENLYVPREEYLGRNMRDILPVELAEKFSSYLEQASESNEIEIVEYEMPIRGRQRWFESRLVSCGENILSVVRDITERKTAENALRESEERLRMAQQAARVGTWEWNVKTGESVWSDMIWELLGLTKGDGPTTIQRFVEFIHPDDRERVWQRVEQVMANGSDDYSDEFRIVRPAGDVMWISSKGRVFRSADRSPERMIGVNIDINKRKLAEETAHATLQKEAAILNAIPDLMFVQTPAGIYLDYHAKDEELVVPAEEFLGKSMWEVLPREAADRCSRAFQSAIETGETQVVEYKLPMPDGKHWYETRIVSAGENIISVVRDITERQRSMDKLRQSEERFSKAFRSNPQPMSLSTLSEGRYLDVNESFLTMSGYMREEVVGHTSLELNIWDTPESRNSFVQQVKELGSVINAETKFRTKRGDLRVLLLSAERLEIGGEQCLLIASSDITERILAEQALQKAHEEVSRLKNQLEAENIYLQEQIRLEQHFGEIIGESGALKHVLFKIEQVAPTDTTVLITGETGTGKELVARAIHNASSRRDRPLVKVNCGALSASLIESELFGHEKGSFTGASARKIGRFELADGATIFLDEIGELPTELQVKLLRVIQEGEFERLGSSKTIKADVRIIAATNRNLDQEVRKGLFREDLWYRLNVFPITVPALRERREDIPLLVEHFVGTFAKKLRKVITSITPATLASLSKYSWPGNVRELANVIERAVINSHGSVLRIGEDFAEAGIEKLARENKTLEELERDYIGRILNETGWRIEGRQGAARILGMNPSTLRARIAKLGLPKTADTHSNAAGQDQV